MYESVHRLKARGQEGPTAVPPFEGTAFDVVVVAASSGSIPLLRSIIGRLPGTFPVPILLVLHIGSNLRSRLPTVLGVTSALRVRWASEGERLQGNTVLIAPPDLHLTVDATFSSRLGRGPKENFTRPAADPLFTSAARHCGPRALGLVLSGYGRDAAAGALALSAAGGTILIQEPESCEASGMPDAVMALGCQSFALQPDVIADALAMLVMFPATAAHFGVGPRAPAPV